VNNLGGGFSDAAVTSPHGPPNGLLASLAASHPDYRTQLDARIKVGVAIAPCGMTHGVWRSEDLHGIKVPALFVSGSLDKTAGYEEGSRAIYENSVNSDRYLLTYMNAGHNAAAPMPVPWEILKSDNKAPAGHYLDPVWDTLRMNNVLAHFVTAFLDRHLKGDAQKASYLDLVPHSKDAVYSMNKDQPGSDHTYWKGFPKGTTQGLIFEHLPPGK
jgi:predicted dienelactone hydrolase